MKKVNRMLCWAVMSLTLVMFSCNNPSLTSAVKGNIDPVVTANSTGLALEGLYETQKSASTVLDVTPASIGIGGNGGTRTVNVMSNGIWTVSFVAFRQVWSI